MNWWTDPDGPTPVGWTLVGLMAVGCILIGWGVLTGRLGP